MKSIEVIVGPAGEVTVEAVGFKGAGCEAATRAIEEALGLVSKRKIMPEHGQQMRNAECGLRIGKQRT